MSIKHIAKIAILIVKVTILTPVFWAVAIATVLFYFSTTKVSDPLDKNSYRKSDFNNWIVIPDSVSKVDANFYGGKDANYRTLLIEGDIGNPKEFIENSIQKNVQHSSEEVVWMEKIQYSLEGLASSFRYGEQTIPRWWVNFSLVGKYKTTIAYWTHNNHGMGYLVLYDKNYSLVLQFSQQWLSEDILRKSFPPQTSSEETQP